MEKKVLNFRKSEKRKFLHFLETYKNYDVYDLFEKLSIQYEVIKKPEYYFAPKDKKDEFIKNLKENLVKGEFYSSGSWVVLPSQKEIYHLLKINDYLDFRTFSNR